MSQPPQSTSEQILAWLPDSLAERVRFIADRPLAASESGGEFVLYWMHHAVRGHENPALDVALASALELDLPLIMYQGLGGRHPFNNDRHHTFIIEGAREAAAELRERGIRHVFSLPSDTSAPSPLRGLAARAAMVITEDFPAPPFPKWTRALADRVTCPVLAVDAACVAPMQLVPGVHERAFKFRDKAKKLFRQRADRSYQEITDRPTAADDIDVGFEPLDLASSDVAEAIAGCDIDHAIAPIGHTAGGSAAGYDRWEEFKSRGLARYHKRRNAAEIEPEQLAISRLSPYLHHGQISPFRVIREARELAEGASREGAEKFLDEVWMWREFAHHFAFTRADDLHSTRVLPDWARQTIADHADDPRTLLDGETLARGRTGDNLWDAAQRSLLAQGELHNNVRMTWGKAMLGWHAGARPTMARLIELNHRYALDGCDPNSYGGLLWCLGALDRPFNHDEPIYGTLRTRPTHEHEARMDIDRYKRAVTRQSWRGPSRVAIIGGGITGLAAARTLADHNAEVTVYDDMGEPGGRVATHRLGDATCDHGAQYFTARDPMFSRLVESWVQQGVVAEWDARFAAVSEPGGIVAKAKGDPRFVGVPGMSALAAHLATTLGNSARVRHGRRVVMLEHRDDGWSVTTEGSTGDDVFDAVIVALPPAEAAKLLSGQTRIAGEIGSVEMSPCWATLVSLPEPLAIDADGLFVNIDGGPLAWAARDSSKPGRDPGERWVLHAGPAWTKEHRSTDAADVGRALLDAFADATGVNMPEPLAVESYLWQHALGGADEGSGVLFDADKHLAVAGDWCKGGRVEGAYLSGVAAAGRLLGHIVQESKQQARQEGKQEAVAAPAGAK